MQGQVILDRPSKTYLTRQRQGLFKSHRQPVEALRGVSLEIKPGEIFGLLGPNGAGKTTLIKCLTTLLLPTSGEAWVNGFRLTHEDNQIRASVGCMLMGDRGLYWKLTGRENLIFFGALYHLSPSERRRRADDIIALLKLEPLADRTVETYSSGQKMRFAFAALTLRIREAAQTMANLLQFSFMILCAPFFPFAGLPVWVQAISRAIPLSYGVDAFRSTLMDYPPGFPELAPFNVELWIVTVFGVLMPVVGYWLYGRSEDRARRIGSLSEY